ncbi:MAG: hypothetical protein J6J12_00245 [Oscillospiraceae bacterium]|nr:hypothetical protein [Oscillospiraceae bacterium]
MEHINNIKAFTDTLIRMVKGEGVFGRHPECKYLGTLHGFDFVVTRVGDGELTIKFTKE